MCLCPTIQLLKVGPKSFVAMWGFRGFSLLTASLATEYSVKFAVNNVFLQGVINNITFSS